MGSINLPAMLAGELVFCFNVLLQRIQRTKSPFTPVTVEIMGLLMLCEFFRGREFFIAFIARKVMFGLGMLI